MTFRRVQRELLVHWKQGGLSQEEVTQGLYVGRNVVSRAWNSFLTAESAFSTNGGG